MYTSPTTDSFIDRLLARNREWADGLRRLNPDTLKYLADHGQKPQALWIGCADSRVPESVITASVPGDVFVHRNIANQFSAQDTNAAAALQYAVEHLHVAHVVVAGHTQCGGVTAALKDATPPCARGDVSPGPVLKDWLAVLVRLAEDLGLTYPSGLAALTEENVKNAMRLVRDYLEGLNPELESSGRCPPQCAEVTIVGMVYDLETGVLGKVGERISVRVFRRKATPGVEVYPERSSHGPRYLHMTNPTVLDAKL